MVPVARHHARRAVHIRVPPLRIVRQSVARDVVAVRLQIGLVYDVQPVLIAQRVPPAVVRVVAGAHAVDVVRLHQRDVADHRLHAHHRPQLFVELVPVDAAQLHGHSVDQQPAALRLHRPEPHVQTLHFRRVALVVLQHHQQRVQIRLFRRPRVHLRHAEAQAHLLLVPRVDTDALGQRLSHARAPIV